jgi:hypothetical protein
MTTTPEEPEFGDWDLISLDHAAEPTHGRQMPGPTMVRVHSASVCANDPHCCIHNPSVHRLDSAKMNWRADKGLMERICEHGIGHPDPDDIAHKRRTIGEDYASAMAVHGCDGCCRA